jgi:RNA polymerase sigma-70 factor (ECF subfamily)
MDVSAAQVPTNETAEIEAAKADPRRFTPLYERYHADVFRFVHRRVRRMELAADLSQETFLKALLALPRYEDRGYPFRAWLYRIALNEVRMHWRKRKEVLIEIGRVEVFGLSEEIGTGTSEEDLLRLTSALSKLDEAKAQLIELRYMDGMSFAELGQVLGIAEDAAKMRTHRVLAVLRAYLTPRV